MKTIAVVTVNYKGKQDSIDFVESMLQQNALGNDLAISIVIVDNFSPDNSFCVLSERFKDTSIVKTISSDRNGGYAYGINFGIKYALANSKPEYILAINNDVVASPDLLSNLVQAIKKTDPNDPLAITGKIFYYAEPGKIWYAGGDFSRLRCMGMHTGIGKLDSEAFNKSRELTFATGCMWFFRASLVETVGFMPEEYFMYFEDVDYSLKVINAGGKLLYEPSAVIWHKVGASSSSVGTDYFLPNRNRIYLARKFLSRRERLCFYSFFILSRSLRFVQFFFRGRIVNTFKGIRQGFQMRITDDQEQPDTTPSV